MSGKRIGLSELKYVINAIARTLSEPTPTKTCFDLHDIRDRLHQFFAAVGSG